MPYRICKTVELESGHMLSKRTDKCRYPHGHSRQVELVLEAQTLDHNNMVCDFGVLKLALQEFLESFDHAMCVNTNDPMYRTLKEAFGPRVIGFDGQDPTTEVLARLIHDRVCEHLKRYAEAGHAQYPLAAGVRLARVRVWETSTSWAEYEP